MDSPGRGSCAGASIVLTSRFQSEFDDAHRGSGSSSTLSGKTSTSAKFSCGASDNSGVEIFHLKVQNIQFFQSLIPTRRLGLGLESMLHSPSLRKGRQCEE